MFGVLEGVRVFGVLPTLKALKGGPLPHVWRLSEPNGLESYFSQKLLTLKTLKTLDKYKNTDILPPVFTTNQFIGEAQDDIRRYVHNENIFEG